MTTNVLLTYSTEEGETVDVLGEFLECPGVLLEGDTDGSRVEGGGGAVDEDAIKQQALDGHSHEQVVDPAENGGKCLAH